MFPWGVNAALITQKPANFQQKLVDEPRVAILHFYPLKAYVFLTFVQTILVPTLRSGQIVIMDNLSSHKVNGVQEAIEAVGATLDYLPASAPDCSPIEACWSKFKEFLRAKAARTRERLDQAITEALETITPQDARGWFAHCGYL
jgi:transposase